MPTDPVLTEALLNYSPQVQASYRRSKYLEDALAALSQQPEAPRSYGEVASKLLATALLEKGRKKADMQLRDALMQDQQQRTKPLLDWLQSQGAPAAGEQPQPFAPAISLPQQPQQPQPQPSSVPQLAPADKLAMLNAGYGEARGEPAAGQQGVMNVILNRAKATGLSPADVVAQPHQFSGFDPTRQVDPNSPQYAPLNGAIDAALQSDVTGGADHFFNPQLAHPSWGQGAGQMIGHHKFMALGDQKQVAAPNAAQAGVPAAASIAPLVAPTMYAPPQVQQQMTQQSAPASRGITPEQASLAKDLLSNPQTYQEGIQYLQSLRQKLAEPTNYKDVQVNGIPMAYDPQHPDQIRPMFPNGLPQQAMTQDIPTPQGLPQGTLAQQSPTGQKSIVYQPPAGYQGPPTRQAAIPGGPADPASGMNLVQNEGKLRDDYNRDIQPYLGARLGYQKVVSAARDSSGASDIALVFGFMKTLDPNSTVREGEQATVQNSGSVPQTIMNMYNKALSGERLQPEQRQQFAQTAQHQFQVYQQQFDAINQRYAGMAQSYGFDPKRILMTQPPLENPPAHQAGPPKLSPQEAARLPKGAHFIGLDGVERVRQ